MTKKEFLSLEKEAFSRNDKAGNKLLTWHIIVFVSSFVLLLSLIETIRNFLCLGVSPSGMRSIGEYISVLIGKNSFSTIFLDLLGIPIEVQHNIFIVTAIIYILISPIFRYCTYKMHMEISKGNNFKYSELLRSSLNIKTYLKLFTINILKHLMFFAILLTWLALLFLADRMALDTIAESNISTLKMLPICICALAVPVLLIFIYSHFSMDYFVLIENPKMSIFEILSKSVRMMKGNVIEYLKTCGYFFKYFTLGILAITFLLTVRYIFMLFFIISIPACTAGLIYRINTFITAKTIFYNKIKEENQSAP